MVVSCEARLAQFAGAEKFRIFPRRIPKIVRQLRAEGALGGDVIAGAEKVHAEHVRRQADAQTRISDGKIDARGAATLKSGAKLNSAVPNRIVPIYEYKCKKCGHIFERIQKFSDPPVRKCPECGGSVEQVLSAPAVQFKGSGWYVTDYARKGGGASKDGGEGAGKTEAKPESEKAGEKPSEKPKEAKHKPHKK
jgi:putative FmdB family regulatory protein